VESEDDGSGGAYAIVHPIDLGPKFVPPSTWIGGHITAQFPDSDIYPVFIGDEVRRVDGASFAAPITPGHSFRGRPALQVSRKTNRLDPQFQTAACKFQKVIYWLTNQS